MTGLARHTRVLDIVGDIVRVRATGVANEDIAIIENPDGLTSLARVVEISKDKVSLQVFTGAKGMSTGASVRFLGRPMDVAFSDAILGRTFGGDGQPRDGGPDLDLEPRVEIDGPSVNPVKRIMPKNMIRTDVPMIDVFNALVESQKIPIFTVAGEPYNELLARLGAHANADIIVFGGMGLIFDDFHFFRTFFESQGVQHRTVMFVNEASDPIVERLLIPDMALAVAEHFAVDQNKRVLVLLTDMTSYADAMKEIGVAMEKIPSNRGYMGDLYSQLARRYEKACDYDGAGSVTLVTVTTLPGNDVTHPVPDNTGYITEGQFYLHGGMIDPFGSLSRLKQHVVDHTRDDHGQIMNTMIRLFSGAVEAEKKKAMAFDLTDYDERLVAFGTDFRNRFMRVQVSLPLEEALDLCWRTMAEHFGRDELLMKEHLINKYYPDLSAES